MLFSSVMTLIRGAADNQEYQADVVITPQIAHIRPDRMGQRKECFALGESETRTQIEEIKRLISG